MKCINFSENIPTWIFFSFIKKESKLMLSSIDIINSSYEHIGAYKNYKEPDLYKVK